MTAGPELPPDAIAAIREHSRRFTILGAILIVLGVLAILFPLVASIAAKLLVGWFLLLSGAAMLFYAFQARRWRSALWSGLVGVVYLAVGVYLVFFPLTGLLGLTALMAFLFLIQGGFEMAIWIQNRDAGRGMVWSLVSGLASLVLGIILLLGLPETALWALGIFLGINLLTSGIAFVTLARLG